MKKFGSLYAASLVILMVSTKVQAQSSVTLYGILDTGIAYVHNSSGRSSQVLMMPGTAGPRWGFKGSEDLGGGLKAVFDLENGFSIANGRNSQDNGLFSRQAWVGLSSDRYGALTLGRQYDPLTDFAQPLTADWVYGPMFATPGDVDNYDDSARFNNSVKWASPNYRGLKAEAMYAFGGVAGSVASGQTWSGALGYQTGPVALAAGFTHIDYGNAALGKRGMSSADSLFESPVTAGYATAKSVDIAKLVGEYTSGPVVAGAAYSFSSYNADADSTFGHDQKFHNVSVFAAYNFSPTLRAGLGYNYTRALGDASARYHSFQIGANYNFSKRTGIYVLGGYMHAIGQQRNTDGSLGGAEAVIGSFDIASGASTQAIGMIGMFHLF